MNTLSCRAAVAVLTASLAGCGGAGADNVHPETPASLSSPAPSSAAPAVAQLSLYLSDQTRMPLAAAVAARLHGALVAAGYNVVASEAVPHDMTAHVAVNVTSGQTRYQAPVSVRRSLRVHVVLRMIGQSGVIDEIASDFDSSNGQVTDDDVAPLVAGLNASARLASYASGQANARQAHAAEDQTAPDQVQTQQQATMAADKAAWDAMAEPCRTPTTLTSCDALTAWYASTTPRPGAGAAAPSDVQLASRRADARSILDAAAPALSELAWSPARDECAAAAGPKACQALKQWLQQHPGSSHDAEGQATLRTAAPKLRALDEHAWKAANVGRCRSPTTLDACDGVSDYVHAFPDGVHSDEAVGLLQAMDGQRTDIIARQQAEGFSRAMAKCKQECESRGLCAGAQDHDACLSTCAYTCTKGPIR